MLKARETVSALNASGSGLGKKWKHFVLRLRLSRGADWRYCKSEQLSLHSFHLQRPTSCWTCTCTSWTCVCVNACQSVLPHFLLPSRPYWPHIWHSLAMYVRWASAVCQGGIINPSLPSLLYTTTTTLPTPRKHVISQTLVTIKGNCRHLCLLFQKSIFHSLEDYFPKVGVLN